MSHGRLEHTVISSNSTLICWLLVHDVAGSSGLAISSEFVSIIFVSINTSAFHCD